MRNSRIDFEVGAGETFKPVLRWGVDTLSSHVITGLTKAAPAVVTAVGHSIPDGWEVAVISPQGMTQIAAAHYPPSGRDWHKFHALTADAGQLTDVNSGNYSAYTSGGWLVHHAPVDLTGATASMVIKDAPDGTVLATLTHTSGLALNTSTCTITPLLETAALTWTLGYYELEVTISGRIYQVCSGTIAVVAGGTGVRPVPGVTVIDNTGLVGLGSVVLSGGMTLAPAEVPSGALNGVNMTYTLAHTPISGTLMVFINNAFATAGVDYTLSGLTITKLGVALGSTESIAVGPYWY